MAKVLIIEDDDVIARGADGSPYAQLGAIAGVAYLVTVVVLRLRG